MVTCAVGIENKRYDAIGYESENDILVLTTQQVHRWFLIFVHVFKHFLLVRNSLHFCLPGIPLLLALDFLEPAFIFNVYS